MSDRTPGSVRSAFPAGDPAAANDSAQGAPPVSATQAIPGTGTQRAQAAAGQSAPTGRTRAGPPGGGGRRGGGPPRRPPRGGARGAGGPRRGGGGGPGRGRPPPLLRPPGTAGPPTGRPSGPPRGPPREGRRGEAAAPV